MENQNPFLNKRWLTNHLNQIQEIAGARYIPKLNVELPIWDIFNGISRVKSFYYSIRKHYGKLVRGFNRISSELHDPKLKKFYKDFKNEFILLSNLLSKIREYDNCVIPWDDIFKQTKKSQELLWVFLKNLKKAKEEVEKDRKESYSQFSEKYNSDIYYLFETQKELQFFEELASSSEAKLSNIPFLNLTGSAGTGKTHLLCDITRIRIENENSYPTILLFGEHFYDKKDVWSQIIKQLNLREKFSNKEELLYSLDKAGEKTQCRVLLMIDALNETRPLDFWRENLDSIIKEIKKYLNIALVISVRSGFEDDILTNEQKQKFVQEKHHGFSFKGWEAVSKFFNEFSLPPQETPLLVPEFQNPLFLLLFCKAFEDRAKENIKRKKKGKREKQIFRGHEGATYIFEEFTEEAGRRVAEQLNIDKGKYKSKGYRIWEEFIKKIASEMVAQNDNKVSEKKIKEILKDIYPSVNENDFVREVERNLLLVKVPRYTKEEEEKDFIFKFPFQKFSDHLIVRYIFKKFEKEVGKQNKSLKIAKDFFSKRRKLGKFISNSWNKGIIEALSVQCPEQLKGIEFIEVAPYLIKDSNYLSQIGEEAFVESLVWRDPKAFSKDKKNTFNIINKHIIRTESGYNQLLNAFLTVAPIPGHPLDAEFLHQHLSKFTMPERDSRWSTFLHHQYREQGAVDRLLQWVWSEQDKSYTDESIFLIAIILSWFLTTSNRYVRDKATRGLICLLQNKIHLITKLIKKFKDVNDPYVLERLYAVAYGCVLRNQRDKINLEKLVLWIYNNIFKDNKPPIHILLRDYARGIIKIALKRGINLNIKVEKINPPYESEFPKDVSSVQELKEKYYPEDSFNGKTKERGYLYIWFSIMHNFKSLGDFGNYVINHHLNSWNSRNINDLSLENKKRILQKFENSLSDNQRKLFEENKNIKPLVEISSLIKDKDVENIPFDIKELKRETKKSEDLIEKDFKESLSEEQRNHFEVEIEPFLNGNYEIEDKKEYFDTGLAQRWIFKRVIELGWRPELHGEFDEYIKRYDRTEHKAERIGKKYQWIALHEFLARVSDNFQFKGDVWENKTKKYKGPWNPYIRDIDPSYLIKNDSHIHKIANFEKWKDLYANYDARSENIMDKEWIRKLDDLPVVEDILSIEDDIGNKWLLLDGLIKWEEEPPPEEEKYNLQMRKLYYLVRGYIVRKKDLKKFFEWGKKQDFMERWMPEFREFYECFLGEYPNLKAYTDLRGDCNIWTKGFSNNLPVEVVVLSDAYKKELSTLDCSYYNSFIVKLPSKWIVNEMGLEHKNIDGIFYNKQDEIVTIPTNIFRENNLSGLLIKRNKLYEFLNEYDYGIFWAVTGEKNMLGGDYSRGTWIGRLELSGAYILRDGFEIIGELKYKFKE